MPGGNGCAGTAISYDKVKDLYAVHIGTDWTLSVRAANLRLYDDWQAQTSESPSKLELKEQLTCVEAELASYKQARTTPTKAQLRAKLASVEADLSRVEGELEQTKIHLETPPHLRCPITLQRMRSPVVVADGHSFDRAAISRWLRTHSTNPLTGGILSTTNIIPSLSLRDAIREWEVANGRMIPPPGSPLPLPIAAAEEAEEQRQRQQREEELRQLDEVVQRLARQEQVLERLERLEAIGRAVGGVEHLGGSVQQQPDPPTTSQPGRLPEAEDLGNGRYSVAVPRGVRIGQVFEAYVELPANMRRTRGFGVVQTSDSVWFERPAGHLPGNTVTAYSTSMTTDEIDAHHLRQEAEEQRRARRLAMAVVV